MKDYAKRSKKSKQGSRNSIYHFIYSFFSKLFFLLKVSLSLVFILVVIVVIVWIFFSDSFQEKSHLTFVYHIKCSKPNIGEIYYASYHPISKKMSVYRVKKDHQFLWPNFQKGVMISSSFSEHVAENVAENDAAIYPWIIGQLVDEVIILDKNEDCLLLEEGLDVGSFIKKISLKRIWSREELTFFNKIQRWIGISIADWDEIKDFSQPIKASGSALTHCSIAILNSTDISGYAQGFSAILENSGYRVIRIDSSLEKNKISTVASVDKPDCKNLADKFAKKLFDWVEILEDQKSDELTSKYRADVVVTLGQGL